MKPDRYPVEEEQMHRRPQRTRRPTRNNYPRNTRGQSFSPSVGPSASVDFPLLPPQTKRNSDGVSGCQPSEPLPPQLK